MLDIGEVFSALLGLFLLIGVGFAGAKVGVLSTEHTPQLSRLLMNITMPATLFSALVQPFDAAFMREGVLIVLLGSAFILLGGAISWGCSYPCQVKSSRRGCWVFSCMFNNNGFMGFPIALALFGQEGLALAAFLSIPFSILAFTLGAKLMVLDGQRTEQTETISWKSILLTPVNGAMVLGLLFYILQIPLPSALSTPITHLSNVTTPLSMLITGITLSGGEVKQIFCNRDAITASLMRLLILPLLTVAGLRLVPIDNPVFVGVMVVIMSMPAAAVGTILADTYGADTEFAAETVFLSSILCLVTIPLMTLLL